ncbi:hypothetical protein [Blattabacterium cuenoti]|uniref:hypothetical protein n=1 Tax=Blattabacterium cuenoti TaxID=1653831 RepID=UPI00163C5DB4|nr:hypothetical protein [Blattabacterium cuenoti]
MFRNIFSVFIGIIVSITEIIIATKLVKKWFINNIQLIPLKNLQDVFIHAPTKFFIILIFFYTLSPFLGGIITAFFVRKAKKAYAVLNGFILFFIVLIHIYFCSFPFWFKIIIFPIFLPLSYLGGELIENFYKKKFFTNKKKNPDK